MLIKCLDTGETISVAEVLGPMPLPLLYPLLYPCAHCWLCEGVRWRV